uniref:Uncharacterized protein n=1 Tax=Arundo donax TaxID=35708 RepID=A0A0A9CIJ3_ARUDO
MYRTLDICTNMATSLWHMIENYCTAAHKDYFLPEGYQQLGIITST